MGPVMGWLLVIIGLVHIIIIISSIIFPSSHEWMVTSVGSSMCKNVASVKTLIVYRKEDVIVTVIVIAIFFQITHTRLLLYVRIRVDLSALRRVATRYFTGVCTV